MARNTKTYSPMTGESLEWKRALEDYMVESPNDWIAKWLYGGIDTGLWEESMYGDILREWYGETKKGWLSRTSPGWYTLGREGREFSPMVPEPAWMSEMGLISERGEDVRGPLTGFEKEEGAPSWWNWPGEAIYATAPGQATGIRPLGAQANLTTEQLDQLLYYQAYLKGGKPESKEDYLQTMAYKMPGWIQDYISTSQSRWPTVAPPRARMSPAWQR